MAFYAAPALLCAVALGQRYLAEAHELDSWKGGGFGMYASMHAKGNRFVSVTVTLGDGSQQRIGPRALEAWLPMSGRMARTREAVLMMPSESRVRNLARALAEANWVLAAGSATPVLEMDVPPHASVEPIAPQAIRVDVWEYTFGSESRLLQLGNLVTVTEQIERS